MNEQIPFAQVEVRFLQAVMSYIEQMPLKEVKNFSANLDQILGNTQEQYAQVDLGFLQALVDYLQEKPYKEVFQFVNILTGQNKPQEPQMPEAPMPEPNISEHIPEGFDASESTTEEG
jgi:hypothetical protein